MSVYAEAWLAAFTQTCLIEVPLYGLLLHKKIGVSRGILLALTLNALSHPILWFVLPKFEPYYLWLLFGETTVVIIELLGLMIGCRAWGYKVAFVTALGMAVSINFLSALSGLL